MTPKQFETVLRVRRHQRDRVRMAMAHILREGRAISARLQQTESERSAALAAIRSTTSGGRVDIDSAAAHRFHAASLTIELAQLKNAAAANAGHVRAAQTALTNADRAVKAVERLRERQERIERITAERRADRDATDLFTATNYQSAVTQDAHAGGPGAC